MSSTGFIERAVRPAPVPLLTRATANVDIDHALRKNRLIRVIRGVYAPAWLWRELRPSERYLAMVHAVAALAPDAVFCLESAAALTSLPVLGHPPEVHVLDMRGSAARRIDRVRVHVSREPRELIRVDGILVTSPEETVVDLARQRHPVIGLAAADALLRQRDWTDGGPLAERNQTRRGSRGRRVAQWPIEFASPLSESVLESVSRASVHWLGYPEPELQVGFSLSSGEHRVDMFWRRFDAIGEADGKLKYDGSLGDPADALWKEKRREDELRRRVRAFTRWAWDDVESFETLDGIVGGLGIPRIEPVRYAPLMTLPGALRGR